MIILIFVKYLPNRGWDTKKLTKNNDRYTSPMLSIPIGKVHEVLLMCAAAKRTPCILGPPGIGKSDIVASFALEAGMEMVSLLGSQLAPEDVMGVPRLLPNGTSEFCPPSLIARDTPFVLFLDELPAASIEVMKAFYSLIHERRVGHHRLHPETVVIAAGNRLQDHAIARPMPSALMNRMWFVEVEASLQDWMVWAHAHHIHPLVTTYLEKRPSHLTMMPQKPNEIFTSPRSWHLLSDLLVQAQVPMQGDKRMRPTIEMIAHGCLYGHHASSFVAHACIDEDRGLLDRILREEASWPRDPDQRDLLHWLASDFRARLAKLPRTNNGLKGETERFVHVAKGRLMDLAKISTDLAQMVIADDEQNQSLPDWFVMNVAQDLGRIGVKKS
jgi:hypothetical protein